ncbi:hypothetical protein CNR22_05975 [Sphingobacteriaceae bacterium]|nr:hypothetical protein CNR22_05975 [Sphingobacteriaceae bacterium]
MFNSSRLIKNTRLNKLYKQNLIDLSQSSKIWELSFTGETLWNGREIKFITLADQSKKLVLALEAIEINSSVETQIVKMLTRLGKLKQLPSLLVYDHSAFISIGLDKWCREHSVKQIYLYSGHTTPGSYLARYARRRNADTLLSYNRSAPLSFK